MTRLKWGIITQSSRLLEQFHDFCNGEWMCHLNQCTYIKGPQEEQNASLRDTKDPRLIELLLGSQFCQIQLNCMDLVPLCCKRPYLIYQAFLWPVHKTNDRGVITVFTYWTWSSYHFLQLSNLPHANQSLVSSVTLSHKKSDQWLLDHSHLSCSVITA